MNPVGDINLGPDVWTEFDSEESMIFDTKGGEDIKFKGRIVPNEYLKEWAIMRKWKEKEDEDLE